MYRQLVNISSFASLLVFISSEFVYGEFSVNVYLYFVLTLIVFYVAYSSVVPSTMQLPRKTHSLRTSVCLCMRSLGGLLFNVCIRPVIMCVYIIVAYSLYGASIYHYSCLRSIHDWCYMLVLQLFLFPCFSVRLCVVCN